MPFIKGQSGNPGGRPKTKPFREALLTEIDAAGEDASALRSIARKLLQMAEEGDLLAVREIADRLDGKPTQGVEHTGQDGGPIETKEITAREMIANRLSSIAASQIRTEGQA